MSRIIRLDRVLYKDIVVLTEGGFQVMTSMLVLAATLSPGGIISWLIIGLVAGAIADWIIPGKGFGLLGNMVIGLVGAFIGGFLFNLLMPDEAFGFWGSLVIAILGASVLFLIIGMVRKRSV
jgi:uncharacterized membrane protein YeaQ/YmgE (transglycosylase-associated protein family)